MYIHSIRNGIRNTNESVVLKHNMTPSIPDIKNMKKDSLAAFFSPKEVAYVFTPNFRSPSTSCIPSGRS